MIISPTIMSCEFFDPTKCPGNKEIIGVKLSLKKILKTLGEKIPTKDLIKATCRSNSDYLRKEHCIKFQNNSK